MRQGAATDASVSFGQIAGNVPRSKAISRPFVTALLLCLRMAAEEEQRALELSALSRMGLGQHAVQARSEASPLENLVKIEERSARSRRAPSVSTSSSTRRPVAA